MDILSHSTGALVHIPLVHVHSFVGVRNPLAVDVLVLTVSLPLDLLALMFYHPQAGARPLPGQHIRLVATQRQMLPRRRRDSASWEYSPMF
jgi:hypothetical protein